MLFFKKYVYLQQEKFKRFIMGKDVKLYLFVNKDGTEMMSNERPRRIVDYIRENIPEAHKLKSCLSRQQALAMAYKMEDGWYTSVEDSDYGRFNGVDLNLWDDVIELPDGFIKNLIGQELTFYNDPFEYTIDNFMNYGKEKRD